MKLSGMMKLRLGITVVFLLLIVSLVVSLYANRLETNADEVFYERLTTEDIDDMNRVFGKYPITNTEDFLLIVGLLVWIAVLGISYLMYRVWNVKEIK